jgi:hypothetical protein
VSLPDEFPRQRSREDGFFGLIVERMTDIEVRFANNGDDGSLIERQLLRRAGVKRKSRMCPTENRVANVAPLRLGWYFTDHDSRLVSGRILKRDVKIAVRFDFESDNAACEVLGKSSLTISAKPVRLRMRLSCGFKRPNNLHRRRASRRRETLKLSRVRSRSN